MEFRLGELFCGPGGLALGASRAHIKTHEENWSVKHIWATDMDEDSCETFRTNLCPDNPTSVICSPIKKLELPLLSNINALAFGFPCNDFSIVGERKGINGKYGALYRHGVDILDRFKPDWFIAENVPGLGKMHNKTAFLKILEELREAGGGYRITPHLYRFEDYGVPQRRHRIIIVGIHMRHRFDFRVPAPTTANQPLTAKEAIMQPPISPKAVNNEPPIHKPWVVERLKHIPVNQNAWFKGIPKHLQLHVKGAHLSQIYKRLRPDAPAYTVTGSGGGGTHVYHWKEPRALTGREKARLQTFPDWYRFVGGRESVRRQIGMAVPPLGAKVIIRAVLKSFAGIQYRSISPRLENGFHSAHENGLAVQPILELNLVETAADLLLQNQ
jgi:DNA (cytosine-5)-methyltransferase 1